MRAEKGNKVYTISEKEQNTYINEGFDIFDKDGKKIFSGKRKSISVDEYEKLKQENENLREELEKAKSDTDEEDVITILKAYAAEHDIETGQARTVSGIMKKLKEEIPEKNEKAGE